MTPSLTCFEFLKKWEGYSEKVYKDAAGEATIGFGHKLENSEVYNYERIPITEPIAELLLCEDVKIAAAAVNRVIDYLDIGQNRYDAMVAFAFNVGGHRLERSMLAKLVRRRLFFLAAQEFLRWDHVNGEVIEGLLKRREAERDLFMKDAV